MLLADIRPARKFHVLSCSTHGSFENKGQTRISKTGHIVKLTLLLICSFVLPLLSYSQGEWNNWYFGWHAAMKFVSGNPVGVTGSAMPVSSGANSTTVSDSLGNLLFYANGWKIWNRNNVVMPNGSGLMGGNICE